MGPPDIIETDARKNFTHLMIGTSLYNFQDWVAFVKLQQFKSLGFDIDSTFHNNKNHSDHLPHHMCSLHSAGESVGGWNLVQDKFSMDWLFLVTVKAGVCVVVAPASPVGDHHSQWL